MTLKELSQLYYLNREIEMDKRRLWELEANLRKPAKEKPVEVKREYSERRPPQAPKGYILVESKQTKYGYLYFKYVLDPRAQGMSANR